MKHTVKRMLALLVATLLAMPTVSFAEMPVEVPVIDDTVIEGEAPGEPEIEPAMDEAEVVALLDPSEALNGDLTLEDAPQSEAGAVVTYRFIVDNAPVAVQEAREGDEIIRPADPDAPEGFAFDGWFLEDGARLFADADGDGADDPVVAHPDTLVAEINAYARFTKVESTGESDADEQTDEETSPDTADAEPASPEGKPTEEPTEPSREPSPSGEGGSAKALTEEVLPTAPDSTSDAGEEAASTEPSTGEEETASTGTTDAESASPEGKPFGEPTEPSREPSPDGEGGSAKALTEEVLPTAPDSTSDAEEEAAPAEPSTGEEETIPSDTTDAEPASAEEATTEEEREEAAAKPSQAPSPSGEGGPRSGTDEVVSPEEPTTGEEAEEETTASDTADAEPASPKGENSEEPTEVSIEEPIEAPTDASDEVPTEEPAGDPIPPIPEFNQSQTVSGVTVTVKAAPGVFPEGAELVVNRVPVYRQRQADAAIADLRDADIDVAVSYTFDIKVIDPETREERQPADGQRVEVSFALAEVSDENLDTSVYHVTGEGAGMSAERLDADVDAETVTAIVGGFSLYTVEFTYNTLEYVMQGDTTVALREILDKVGLTGEVTDVAVSDGSLLSVCDEAGQWTVTALESFATTEWMRVTIGGIAYEITVTDDRLISVTYIERSWDGSKVVATEKTVDAQPVPADGNMTSGTYCLNSNATKSGRVESITGNVNLILGNGYTLDVRGLYVPKGSTLTIYAQSEGDNAGRIYSHPSGGAAIGGYSGRDNGNIVIHGGTIDATGYNNCAGIGSNDGRTGGSITIYGGTITATGGSNGAGIGGGRKSHSGNITVYGGKVTAEGSSDGAAIGSGENGVVDKIEIYGGTVTADNSGCENGAGIGGGAGSDGGAINIYGGTVITYSRDGAGIGGGENGEAGTITISGGDITCWDKGQAQGARIGSGNDARNDNKNGVITISGGTIHTWHRDGAGIGGGEGANGGTITISGGEVYAHYAEGGYGNGAAIGGGNDRGEGGNITISAGKVEATGYCSAGIGGGRGPSGSDNSGYAGNITISGGDVRASSRSAIGLGAGGSGSKDANIWDGIAGAIGNAGKITISGGNVRAYGRTAGICADNGTVNITGGTVTVGGTGGNSGYGICMLSKDAVVNITGGTVTAKGEGKCPAIAVEHGTVNITGGTLDAHAYTAPAIGRINTGDDDAKLNVSGKDTVVKAASDTTAGIGSKDWVDIAWNFDQATVEVISGGDVDRCAKIFYKDARIKGGSAASNAKWLPYTEREAAHGNYLYRLVEVCDHKDKNSNSLRDDYGKCLLCDDQAFPIEYVVCSFNSANGLSKQTRDKNEGDVKLFPQANNATLPAGWYYVNEDITVTNRLMLQGNTDLILGDGYTLNVNGLYIPAGKTLRIYGQAKGTGELVSEPTGGGSGIGGYSGYDNGIIVIHGGVITATGDNHCAGIGSNDARTTGNITIYNGTVNATGGSNSAGIGGGRDSDGGNIFIYGGTVTATGKDNSAGIGGGDPNDRRADSSTIEIHGGTVTATGNGKGAGIGGGEYGHADITITGGRVTATGGVSGGAGIGSGADGAASTIDISGGVINASAQYNNACGIGNGANISGSVVTLGYTDKTKATISITATAYGTTVYLKNGFINGNGEYKSTSPGAFPIGNNWKLAKSALVAWDGTLKTWRDLQALIRSVKSGTVIKLDQNYRAASSDGPLTIDDKTVTIDLNGYTLNRDLADTPKADGSVMFVNSDSRLYITDTSESGDGLITGGNTTGNGGGILSAGELFINRGRIEGNRAAKWGGGIYMTDDTHARLVMNGGQVTNNTCGNNGGGIHVSSSARIQVYGSPVVRDNLRNKQRNNINLASGVRINVDDALDAGAVLNVSLSDDTGYFTTGYPAKNAAHPDRFFFADNAEYGVMQRGGEGWIGELVEYWPYISYSWENGALKSTEKRTDSRWMAWPNSKEIPSGQYVLNGNVTVNDRVVLQGDTAILLCNGLTLDVEGLYIPSGATLTIYGQRENQGMLVSHPTGGGAAIGGYSKHDNGAIVIHGGTITATGDGNCAGIGSNSSQKTGNITIYGGKVTAIGGRNGAGIGAGRNSDGGTIRIYGGTVTATGTDSSAGIGGGDADDDKREDFSTIEIYGGTVTATGNSKGAGIGGGEYGRAKITVYGGNVTATGGSTGGAGIGSGADGKGSTVNIIGGVVDARVADASAFGIGNGKNQKGASTVKLSYTGSTSKGISVTSVSYAGKVTLEKAFLCEKTVEVFPPKAYADTSVLAGKTLVAYSTVPVSYLDLYNRTYTELCLPVITAVTNWDDDWYAVTRSVDIPKEITVTGDVDLILADGCTLNVANIKVAAGSSLTIWPQKNGTGKLVANAGANNAGIGGAGSDCGEITINGGDIQATGGTGAAGIGGASGRKPGTVVINRGKVTAIGGGSAAAIGGGYMAGAGSVTITGGTVTANAVDTGAAIGAGACQGASGLGGTVAITGGTVKAVGVSRGRGSAIGAGMYNGGVEIEISGGTVTATGGHVSIGAGYNGHACNTALSWTDESKATMSVTADSYSAYTTTISNNLTLVKDFRDRNDGTPYPAGAYSGSQRWALAKKTLVPDALRKYTVSFDANGGTEVEDQIVREGEKATAPADPTKRGSSFGGWQLNGVDYDFNTPVQKDITLVAAWTLHALSVPSIPDSIYNGVSQTPGLTIRDEVTRQTLREGSEYTVTYANNRNAGTASATVAFIGDYSDNGSVSLTFRISPALVTLSGLSVQDKVYDGSASATVVGTPALIGVAKGDDVQLSAGSAAFDDANAGKNRDVAFSGYSLTGNDAKNYNLFLPVEVRATIFPKEVGLDWGLAEFTYDGQRHAPTATLTGVLSGDTCEVTVTGAQTRAGEGYIATATALSNPNYALPAEKTCRFTIRKADVELTRPEAMTGLKYNGSPQALVTPGSTTGGTLMYSTDGESWSAEVPTGIDAGDYTVRYKVAGDDNHEGVPEASLTVTIGKAAAIPPVNITKYVTVPEQGKPKVVNYTIPGVMPGDAGPLTYTAGGSVRLAPETCAIQPSGFAVSKNEEDDGIVSVTLSGGNVGDSIILPVTIVSRNYADSPVDVTVVLTNKNDAPVTITADGETVSDSLAKIYGDQPFDLSASVQPVEKGDWKWTVSDENVATIEEPANSQVNVTILRAGTTVLTASFNSQNYIGQAVVTLTVDKKEVRLTWGKTEFTYNGKAQAPTATATELKVGDACKVKVTGPQTDAGEYIATATALSNPNYKLPALPADKTTSFTIDPASLTVTTLGDSKPYDGTPLTCTDGAEITGLVNSETAFITATGSQTEVGSSDNSYSITWGTAKASNYAIAQEELGTLEVTANNGLITLTAASASKVYDGTPLTNNSVNVEGLPEGFIVEATASGSQTDAGSSKNVVNDGYVIRNAAGEDRTRSFTNVKTVDGTLTVERKSIKGAKVTLDNKQLTYNGVAQTVSITGVRLDGRTLEEKDYTVSGERSVLKARDAGDYTVTVTGKGNYRDTASETWTIAPANITITADDKTSHYGEALQKLTWQVGGDYVAGDELGITARIEAAKTAGVDTYPIILDWNRNPNYSATLVNSTYTITHIPLTVKVTGYSGVYDGQAHGITVDVGDSGASVYYGLTELTENNYRTEGSATRPLAWREVGEYTVYFYVYAENYEPNPVRGSQKVAIRKKALTVAADARRKTYGEADPALTYKATGLVDGDRLTGSLTRAPGENVGSYAITLGTLTAGDNYDLNFTGANLTIEKAAPTVTAPTAKTLTDTGSAQQLVNAGKATGGTMQYSLDGATWSAAIPTGIDAGSYTVYYRVVGDGNHTDVAPKSLTVTIAPKPTATPTATPKPTATPTATPKPTATPTATPKPTAAPTATPKPTVTPKPTATPKPTVKPTVTPKPTARPAKPDLALMAVLKPSSGSDTALTLIWTRVAGADGYDIFYAKCAAKPWYRTAVTPKGLTAYRYRINHLDKGVAYKAYVRAWRRVDGVKTYVGKASPTLHAITGGYNGKYCNAKSVKVSKSSVKLKVGASAKIKASVKGVKSGRKVLAHEKALRYYSSDRNVATVTASGKIRAKGPGSCTIYAMANNGVRASVKVRVYDGPTKVSFKKSAYSVKKGKKLKLAGQISLKPSGMSTTCAWTSSDPAIATVSAKGVVKGLKKGTVTITVTTANGKTARAKVRVK